MDWQQLAALALVAFAAVWLVRTQILAPRRDGCGGCGSCGSAAPARRTAEGKGEGAGLIQVELELPRSRDPLD